MAAGVRHKIVHHVLPGGDYIVKVAARRQHLPDGGLETGARNLYRFRHQVPLCAGKPLQPICLKFRKALICLLEPQMRPDSRNDLRPHDRLGNVIHPAHFKSLDLCRSVFAGRD